MTLLKNKRGSLELSIQTIVIIVIAMVLLGLGLIFIRNQFGSSQEIVRDLQAEVKKQILEDVQKGDEKLTFAREMRFSRGEEKTTGLGVRNTGTSMLYFTVNLGWDVENSDFGKLALQPDDFELRWDRRCQVLSPSEANAYPLFASAPRKPGTFALRADIRGFTDEACTTPTDPAMYATKTAFVTIG